MSVQTIPCEMKHFNEFLSKCLNRKILKHTIKLLTNPGENYGSILKSVEVQVPSYGYDVNVPIDSPTETLHLVAKTFVLDPSYVEVFQPDVTFVKENRVYSEIVPTIKNFEEISNVPLSERFDAFIHCYGSRISLDPNASVADNDAILLLENVKVLGYDCKDRFVGYNSAETFTILKHLARLHALCIAIRRQQPELFESKITPYLMPINLNIDDIDYKMVESISNELHLVDGLDPELRAKIQNQLKVGDDFIRHTNHTADTPYTTVVHRDLWNNNIMLKYDGDTIKVKIFDFQLYIYESFVHDLIFFLFTSVHPNDLRDNSTYFINFYHATFVETLTMVNCPLDDYTFEKMWNEIQQKAKIELLHVLFMIKMITFDSTHDSNQDPDAFYNWKELPQNCMIRWKVLIDIFNKNAFI